MAPAAPPASPQRIMGLSSESQASHISATKVWGSADGSFPDVAGAGPKKADSIKRYNLSIYLPTIYI